MGLLIFAALIAWLLLMWKWHDITKWFATQKFLRGYWSEPMDAAEDNDEFMRNLNRRIERGDFK